MVSDSIRRYQTVSDSILPKYRGSDSIRKYQMVWGSIKQWQYQQPFPVIDPWFTVRWRQCQLTFFLQGQYPALTFFSQSSIVHCKMAPVLVRQYQAIFGSISQYEAQSGSIRQYQAVSDNIGQYQVISDSIRKYQIVSGSIRQYQAVSGSIRQYWVVSGSIS